MGEQRRLTVADVYDEEYSFLKKRSLAEVRRTVTALSLHSWRNTKRETIRLAAAKDIIKEKIHD